MTGPETAGAAGAGTRRSDEFFEKALGRLPAMVILRGLEPARTVELARVFWDLGARLVEVPVGSSKALDALAGVVEAAAAARGAGREAVAGAGTVRSVSDVREVAALGARFTVAPGWDGDVASASLRAGLPHLPGVMSPTEIHRASAAGFTWLKLFPASVLGPAHLAAMRGPFPAVRFVATGGIGTTNALDYLEAGAAAVSFGGAAVSADRDELGAAFGRLSAWRLGGGSGEDGRRATTEEGSAS
jgi:2-dehydro-3-deoxyphosphogluconate aldolase/(4S)-4-hydroxy-2-oxoglutarate aldolase